MQKAPPQLTTPRRWKSAAEFIKYHLQGSHTAGVLHRLTTPVNVTKVDKW